LPKQRLEDDTVASKSSGPAARATEA